MSEPPAGGPPPPAAAGFASFDSASFFAAQQQERARQEAELRAAADALLPSSSESDSEDGEAEPPAERQAAPPEEARRSSGKKAKRSKERGGRDRDKKRSKRAKRAEEERERAVAAERARGPAGRAPQVKAWAAGAAAAPTDAAYFFDRRGDPGNVAFGGLYRGDIASYRRLDPSGFAAALLGRRAGGRRAAAAADGAAAFRYFGAAVVRAERSARLRRWRRDVHAAARPASAAPADGFLSLDPSRDGEAAQRPLGLTAAQRASLAAAAQQEREAAGGGAASAGADVSLEGETQEEALLRRTRHFNEATRARPHDLRLWLDFAAFQDEAAAAAGMAGGRRRGAERATAEKKIAVLERALEHHPGSDALLLALLAAAAAVCDGPELERRWGRVLGRHGGSPALWGAYLSRRRRALAGFSVGDAAAAHARAAGALLRERDRRAAAGAPAAELAGLEGEVVGVWLQGAGMLMAAGHTEAAVAQAQALVEFNFFAPDGWPEEALLAMFEECWRGGGALVGDPGARGWGGWLAGEPGLPEPAALAGAQATGAAAAAKAKAQQKKREEAEEAQRAEAAAAAAAPASAWEELAPAIRARFGHSLDFQDCAVPPSEHPASGGQDMEEAGQGRAASGGALSDEAPPGSDADSGAEPEEPDEPEAAAEEEEESDEALLARLGLDLDAALQDAGSLTPPVLAAWLRLERRRDAEQWRPRRGGAEGGAGAGAAEDEEEGEGEGEDPLRRVAWEDVQHCAARVVQPAAREQLLLGCLQLLGAPVAGALPSACPAARAAAGAADELSAAAAWLGLGAAGGAGGGLPGEWAWLVGGEGAHSNGGGGSLRQTPWFLAHPSRHAFLLRMLTALAGVPAKDSPPVAAALLDVAAWEVVPAPQLAAPEGGPPRPGDAQNGAPSGGAAAGAPSAAAGLGWAARRAWAPARALARQLLAEQRGSLVLWRAYAGVELAAGAGKAARKVCHTCLAATPRPFTPLDPGLAPLALDLARAELGVGCSGPDDAPPLQVGAVADAAPAALAAALRALAWLGAGGGVGLGGGGGKGASAAAAAALTPEELLAARRGYQGALPEVLRRGAAGFDAAAGAVVAAAAAFEQVAGAAGGGAGASAGVKAALALYEQVLAALLPPAGAESVDATAALEAACVQRCALAAAAAARALPAAPPAAARAAALAALRRFPASTPLLRLLTRVELGGHAVAALRRELRILLAERPSPQVWLALAAVEVATASPADAVRAALERAAASPEGGACPLVWRARVRWEAARGRPDAARRAFLRAVGTCPWSKALWADGLAALNGHAPPEELNEYLSVMRSKELGVRTEVLEVVLEAL